MGDVATVGDLDAAAAGEVGSATDGGADTASGGDTAADRGGGAPVLAATGRDGGSEGPKPSGVETGEAPFTTSNLSKQLTSWPCPHHLLLPSYSFYCCPIMVLFPFHIP